MEATQLPQPVITPAVPTTYDVMKLGGELMVVMPHGDFHAIKYAAMRAMITLELLVEGGMTLRGSADTIQRDIADLNAVWNLTYG